MNGRLRVAAPGPMAVLATLALAGPAAISGACGQQGTAGAPPTDAGGDGSLGDGPRLDAGTTVRIWLTNPADPQARLAEQTPATWTETPPAQGGVVVSVDPTTKFQTMLGIGASITDGAAWLINGLPQAQREALMTALFDPVQGIGLSFLRQPMGASDLSTSVFSYDDLDAGQVDYALEHFSIAHDEAYILPVLREALALDPAITVVASPWSPPGWMKPNGAMIGTYDGSDGPVLPAARAAWAQYFVRFIQAYAAAGVPIYAVSVQNEPTIRSHNVHMGLEPQDYVTLLDAYLAPALLAAGLDTRIWALDDNWSVAESFGLAVLSEASTAPRVGGVSFHAYLGDAGNMDSIVAGYPSLPLYVTEFSSFADASLASNLSLDATQLLIGATRHMARSLVKWGLVLDDDSGPNIRELDAGYAGCGNCSGFAVVHPESGTYTLDDDYFTMGHASKFVRPGAVRVDSTDLDVVPNVAFVNPDGSTALIAYNPATNGSATFTVAAGGRTFSYALPASSVATFVW